MNIPDWLFHQNDESKGLIRELGKGLNATIYVGENMMFSFVSIEPYSEGRIHSHPEEQWGVLLKGECIRIQDGKEFTVSEGHFWQTPGNVQHGIRTGEKGALILDIFSPPRPEYRNKGEGFGNVD